MQKLQCSACSLCSPSLEDGFGVLRNTGTLCCWTLAHFNCWWKDKIHFALGWLPCLLMLITSRAKHLRGHLERSRDLDPPDRSFLMLLPFQGNIVRSEISVCTSAEWVPGDSKGCWAMDADPKQDGGGSPDCQVSPCPPLNVYTCTKVRLKTYSFHNRLYRLQGWGIPGHVCTSLLSSRKFCSLFIIL